MEVAEHWLATVAAAKCSNDTAIHHLKTVFPQVS